MLRFHRFHMPVAAERPASFLFPAYSEAAARPSILTLSLFSLSYAHGRYALTGRFSYHVISAVPESRATGPLTSMFPVISYLSRDDYDICPSHGVLPRLSLTSL